MKRKLPSEISLVEQFIFWKALRKSESRIVHKKNITGEYKCSSINITFCKILTNPANSQRKPHSRARALEDMHTLLDAKNFVLSSNFHEEIKKRCIMISRRLFQKVSVTIDRDAEQKKNNNKGAMEEYEVVLKKMSRKLEESQRYMDYLETTIGEDLVRTKTLDAPQKPESSRISNNIELEQIDLMNKIIYQEDNYQATNGGDLDDGYAYPRRRNNRHYNHNNINRKPEIPKKYIGSSKDETDFTGKKPKVWLYIYRVTRNVSTQYKITLAAAKMRQTSQEKNQLEQISLTKKNCIRQISGPAE
ncbi:hypothetical protein JTB14_021952 [Gonioctena quinquepunctata]|nr:hypothetical protein JTB14_021952 [Gonioctena quinquepunctata]